MKRRFVNRLMIGIISFVSGFSSAVSGQAPASSVAWQRVYRGDVLPEAGDAIGGPGDFRGSFQVVTSGQTPPARITVAKTLLYRDEDTNRRRYFVGTPNSNKGTAEWNAAAGPGTTVEIRLKVLVGAGPGTAGGVQIATGESSYFVRIRTDGIECVSRQYDALGLDFHSDFVTLRYVVPRGNQPAIIQFVDARGRTGEARLHRHDTKANNSFSLAGGGNGDPPNHLEWEIETVRWTHAGAFAWDARLVAQQARRTIVARQEMATKKRRSAKRSTRPIRLSRFRQLFLDDYLVDEMHAIRRQVHSADKHPANPVLNGDLPWLAGMAYLYGAVERHPETRKLRMW